MPVYELVIIAKSIPNSFSLNKRLLKSCATLILDKGGVVRKFENLGQNQELSYKIRRNQTIHDRASIYSMTFDSSPTVMQSLQKDLRFDEDCLRATIIKLGDSIGKISDYTPPKTVY